MLFMENCLEEKKCELKSLIDNIEKDMKGKPEGSLRVSKNRKHYSYYHYMPKQREIYPLGKYISKKDRNLIIHLAQKEYDEKVLRWAKQCYGRLAKFLDIYKDSGCIEIYEGLPQAKKELVTPYELPGEKYAEEWQGIPYIGKKIEKDEAFFVTERGEKVRSKSEKILADIFYGKKIPYKYEAPLLLKGYGTVYPDFTLLNIRTKETWYWEHMGMMENQEYTRKAILKIHTYEQNGIFPGKRLLMSYELKNDLDIKIIRAMIEEYLM